MANPTVSRRVALNALRLEPGVPLQHYWSVLTTAGRAAEGLRASWREHVRLLQERIGFSYIRFHGLFHDEMMVYREDQSGNAYFTWRYVDDLFDFLLSVGLRPFVELGFTPDAMASGKETNFFWKANITPPRDLAAWGRLVEEFVRHCVRRYGEAEVRTWYFEVWNEPNLGGIFWTGGQDAYFELYRRTAEAVKRVDSELRVGGPATSNFTTEHEAPWFAEFSDYCRANGVPVDFFSCHPYPNTWAFDTDGNQLTGYRGMSALRDDLRWLRGFVRGSCAPGAEIHLTEWNSSPSPRDLVHDTAFMAPFLVESCLSASGLVDSLGYWALTDLFEENGLGRGPLHGGFGLMNIHGIPKPAFHAFNLLARLGQTELGRGDGWIVTRSRSRLQVLLWNYGHYTSEFAAGDRTRLTTRDRYGAFEEGCQVEFTVETGAAGSANALESVDAVEVNRESGSVFDAWVAMGAPENLSRDEEETLRAAAEPRVRTFVAESGRFVIPVPVHGVAFLELTEPTGRPDQW
jgi:xylan 1,4-beta-xylosidase